MHQNIYWKAFLLFFLLVVIWFVGVACYQLFNYMTLNEHTTATSTQWHVKELSEEDFRIDVNYTFVASGVKHTGEMRMEGSPFLNQWAAEATIEENMNLPWEVWYSSRNPQHSTLQKYFPFKECLSAVLLLGVFIYFLCLGYYVAHIKK